MTPKQALKRLRNVMKECKQWQPQFKRMEKKYDIMIKEDKERNE